jgi:hypothetical protein
MSSYQVIFKLSSDFSEVQWESYATNFNTIFKRDFTVDYFKTKYAGSSLGYSFHGVLMYADTIVGMFSAIPRKYLFFGKETTITLACDAFILPEHRKDERFLKQMSDVVIDNLKKSNIQYLISIPNKTAYPYWKYYAGWKDIASLNYYIVPLHIGTLLKKWLWLNVFSNLLFRLLILFSKLIYRKSKDSGKNISLLRNKAFFSQRYPSDYNFYYFSNESGFVYRVYDEEGVKTAYLIDCFPLTKSIITRSINKIVNEVGKNVDVIMYIGKIEQLPFCILKVPTKKEPRKQPFIGLCLDKTTAADFYDIANWKIGLANFDNR